MLLCLVSVSEMDTSFELLSSLSPKINKNRRPFKKPPTILALKKHIRRSSIIGGVESSTKNETIITVKSSSSEMLDSGSSSESPIVISDSSEASFDTSNKLLSNSPFKRIGTKCGQQVDCSRLSQEKIDKIRLWVDDVNTAKKNTTYSELSMICGNDNPNYKAPATGVATNSTFLKSNFKRFDELLKNHEDIVINDSLITEDNSVKEKHNRSISEDNSVVISNCKNMVLDDSLNLDLNASLKTRIQKKTSNTKEELESLSDKNSAPCEKLLDDLYGKNWRQSKEDILPLSEPRPKPKGKKIDKKLQKSEKPVKVRKNPYLDDESNNLLKTLQKARFRKALESPLISSIKKICDSDTDPEDLDTFRNVPPTKLDFNADDESNVKVQVRSKKVEQTKNKSSKTEPPTASFLASLSDSVPVIKSDMSALIYRNNFKQNREQLASKLFKLYNENIFDNAVPSDTLLEWNDRMRGTAGYCYCKKVTRRTGIIERTARIVISSKVVDSADRLRDTLVHEMCHAVTWIVNKVSDGHGPFWRSWADRAMEVFPELPPIKRCHQYVINTKYTYRCVSCGYSIGRHTKSLDVEKKRCGYCYGTFEILINKTSKKGETKSVPVTPKKAPTGFALFVKENYANFKTPDYTHAEVMKMLGQKFADVKIGQS